MSGQGFRGGNNKDPHYNKPSRDYKREYYSLTFKGFILDDDIIYLNNNFNIFNNIVSS
jgi:hypothetical protein